MAVNNETGAILPVKEIGALLQEHPAAFHVDAGPSTVNPPIYPEELTDFLSASHLISFMVPKALASFNKKMDFDMHGGDQKKTAELKI